MKDEHTKPEDNLKKSIDHLDKDIAKLDTSIDTLSGKLTFWQTFGRGIVSALGAVIGATLIVALLIYILQKLTGVPILGEGFESILQLLQQQR